ncbi:MAG: DUF433 domain-containing protein [Candidatus Sumerlaeota bacterium]|nr:DUF433 domain-containing protein [Candidatus Sumerlaeota bacterium]
MKWQDFIEQRPDVMLGKPVFKGTRLTVEMVLEKLGNGWPAEDLLAAYPDLSPAHLQAAQAYAAAYLAMDEAIFLPLGQP